MKRKCLSYLICFTLGASSLMAKDLNLKKSLIDISLLKGKNTLKPKDIYYKKGYRLENAIKVKDRIIILTTG